MSGTTTHETTSEEGGMTGDDDGRVARALDAVWHHVDDTVDWCRRMVGVERQPSEAELEPLEPDGEEAVDGEAVLEALSELEVSRWRYDGDDVTHMGPMAEEFHDAFEVGDDRHLTKVDVHGVTLAAVQELASSLEAKEAQVEDLEKTLADKQARIDEVAAENERLREHNERLEARIEDLERRVSAVAGTPGGGETDGTTEDDR